MASQQHDPAALRFELDPQGLAAYERLISYEMVNSLLLINIELQRVFRMRPLEFQIFMVIAMATVQRFVRDPQACADLLDSTPLPTSHRGSISRRRIADTLDLPFETVRRHVAQLIARGEVVETGRGALSTRGGTLMRASSAGATLNIAKRYVAAVNRMQQLGALRITPRSE